MPSKTCNAQALRLTAKDAFPKTLLTLLGHTVCNPFNNLRKVIYLVLDILLASG